MSNDIQGPGPASGYIPISNEVDLATLMFSVQTERADLLDDMVRDQAAKIQYNNDRLKELNEAMSMVNAKTPEGDDTSTICYDKIDALDPATGEIKSYDLDDFLESRGVKLPAGDGNGNYDKEEFNVIVTNTKNSIDSLTSTSQLDMTQLQSTMSKYNQTFEALSSFLSKYYQSLSTITGNLR